MGPIDFTKMAKQMRDDLYKHSNSKGRAEAYLRQAFQLGAEHGWWQHYEENKDARKKEQGLD